MAIHQLEQLTWQQLDALPRDRTVLLMPVSPLEEHGPHLPLGVDCFSAVAFARAGAEAFTEGDPNRHAVLFPLVPLGTWTFDFVGSVWLRQRTTRNLVTEMGESFARYGFRNIVVTNGHGAPGHIAALEEACDRVTARHRDKGVQMVSPLGPMVCKYFEGAYGDQLRSEQDSTLSEEEAALLPGDIHAGFFETSMMLHLHPDLVGKGYDSLPPVTMEGRSLWFSTAKVAGEGLGYLGYPERARADIGKTAIGIVRRELGLLLNRMTAGEDVSGDVHCKYGRIPYYRTDFVPAATGAAAALAALLYWLF